MLCHSWLMLWVGLTGGIASGKTTVAEMLRQRSVPVVDADLFAHQALQALRPDLKQIFGNQILDSEGLVDRKSLSRLVFSDKEKLSQLEDLVHPWVQEKVRQERKKLKAQGVDLAVYDVPLLFEKNLQAQFDKTVVVSVPLEISLKRFMQRNQLSLEEATQRMNHQMDIEEKKTRADFVIDNQGSLRGLEKQVDQLLWAIKK